MIVEIKIDVSENKYGSSLASTEMKLDSDFVDKEALSQLVRGLTTSAMLRAEEKLNKKTPLAPEPVVRPFNETADVPL